MRQVKIPQADEVSNPSMALVEMICDEDPNILPTEFAKKKKNVALESNPTLQELTESACQHLCGRMQKS